MLDEPRVSEWLSQHVGVELPLAFDLVAEGNSNLTYVVTDATGRRCVLRRPPAGALLPSAHDMGREFRIIRALGAAGVPAPRARGLCADTTVIGATFYVMDFVDGAILHDAAAVDRHVAPRLRATVARQFVDTLVLLHDVDPDLAGLGDLGRRDGYAARQLRRWQSQYEASRDEHGAPEVPDLDATRAVLAEAIPEQGRAAIVHGDYRLGNMVIDEDGQVLAVLDWELCTLGDPLADLAYALIWWVGPGEDEIMLPITPTRAGGFPSRDVLAEYYARRSGRDIAALDFYLALSYWKLACIAAGVYGRYLAGRGGGARVDYASYPERIRELASRALSIATHVGAAR